MSAPSGDVKIHRALISAWRKDGLTAFGRGLAELQVEILSTGGSARCLRDAGITVREVSEVTGFPEMMDGRVKTLHPRIHGGLLFRRDVPSHVAAAEQHGIPPIDLVVVDLYPFEEAVMAPGATRADCVEMIDIGGPAMVRAAAKNHDHVAVVTDPEDLPLVLAEMEERLGALSAETRRRLAAKAFRRTAAYDARVAAWMTEEPFPERIVLALDRKVVGRYGENPHQPGAIYVTPFDGEPTVARARELVGEKELSYNNYLDASAAWDAVRGQSRPAVAFIKHRNPCGAAVDDDVLVALEKAHRGDPLSAYGGILAVNRPVDLRLARAIANPTHFLEVLVAPKLTPDALSLIRETVKWGKNLRCLEVGDGSVPQGPVWEFRSIGGGILVQHRDEPDPEIPFTVVTQAQPTEQQTTDLRLAWDLVRNVTSNAIVFVRDGELVGCGAGQMSRVDAVELAAKKAGERAQGAVMASDAFFPFADGILAGASAGIAAVVQPGGSLRDREVIRACDEAGVAMVVTGRRHFRH